MIIWILKIDQERSLQLLEHLIFFYIFFILLQITSFQPVSMEPLIHLFVTTYQGTSTESIHQAFEKLLQISKAYPANFLKECQKILEAQNVNKNLCLSVSNFIKVSTKIIVDQNLISCFGPKDFINKIQHTFDNSKIPGQFKESIAIAYIKAALHFNVNFDRISQKIGYLYQVKEIQNAVMLSRAYLSCDRCIDLKSQGKYYSKILPLELKCLSEEIFGYKKSFSEQGHNDSQKDLKRVSNILEIVKNIHSSLVFIAFETFESSIYKCLQGQQIVDIINSIDSLKDKQIMILLREILQKIVESLFRMRRMQKIPTLTKALNQRLHQQWTQYQEILLNRTQWISHQIQFQQNDFDLDEEISKIRLFTVVLNSRFIQILEDSIDVWNLFIKPLFLIRTRIFNQGKYDIKETLLLFEDVSFTMKSECLEVEFNKLFKTILTNCQLVSSKVMLELDQFLLGNFDFIEILSTSQDKFLILMNLLAFQASYFITQESFIHKMENFIKKYENQLFNHQNKELYFHSLLVLYNYMDDMFCEDLDTEIFYQISRNFVEKRLISLKQGENLDGMTQLIVEFEKKILKGFYSAGFSENQVKRESQIMIVYLIDHFDRQGLLIFIQLMKNYQIEDKIILQIIDRIIEYANESLFVQKMQLKNVYHEMQAFMQFLVAFFDIDALKYLFESTLSRVLDIFEYFISNGGQFQDEFFILISSVVRHLEYVPENYLSWMGNLFNYQRLESQKSFTSLAIVLKFISPSKQSDKNLTYALFVNCIALHLVEILAGCHEQENTKFVQNAIFSLSSSSSVQILKKNSYFSGKLQKTFSKRQLLALLCLHQLIHYHSSYFTRKILKNIINFTATKIISLSDNNVQNKDKQPSFSLLIGKYQLTFVLLFKRRLSDVNQILIQLGKEKNVYDAVYMKDYQYFIEYDTPILIKEQVQILKRFINDDKLQMTYANTSFLTIFYKCFLLYKKKSNPKGKFGSFQNDSEDSDEEDFEPKCQLKVDFKQMTKLVQSFPKPDEWINIDELKKIKQFIQQLRSNQSSKEWLKTLFEKCLNVQQKKFMEDLMGDLQNVHGKYRHILKINKNLTQSGFHTKSSEQVNI